MTWRARTIEACDLDELQDQLNPQLKSLEQVVGTGASRPGVMAGYPIAVGAITSNTLVTVGSTTDETVLKTVDFQRGAFGTNGGFTFRCGGRCAGSGGTKTITISFGGIEIISLSVATGTRSWLLEGEIWNVNATNEQRVRITGWDGASPEIMLISDDTNYTVSVETD